MPELPDIAIYAERLSALAGGGPLLAVRLASPFLLRSVEPPLAASHGRRLRGVTRLGKRIVLELEGELLLVLHLMIAGRLRWKRPGAPVSGHGGLAAFDFERGSLILTEASKKKRASLYVVQGRAGLAEHDRGGVDPLACDEATFVATLRRENRTLKRALTDPRLFSGIGNAYSDEILFAARLSPVTLTSRLRDEDAARLRAETGRVLIEWTARLRAEVGDGYPDKVTAFREDFFVHGRHRSPCRVCARPIQRIRFADNELNYCAVCQCGGKLLADRGLSRLLKQDWPKSLDELELLRSP